MSSELTFSVEHQHSMCGHGWWTGKRAAFGSEQTKNRTSALAEIERTLALNLQIWALWQSGQTDKTMKTSMLDIRKKLFQTQECYPMWTVVVEPSWVDGSCNCASMSLVQTTSWPLKDCYLENPLGQNGMGCCPPGSKQLMMSFKIWWIWSVKVLK